jgi:hypothetical protein
MLLRCSRFVVAGAALFAAGCDMRRSDAEHLLLRWTEVLNLHLASSFDEGNQYPVRLVDVDPLLRLDLAFEDPWGGALYYRKINDSQYDLASAGPDGEVGNEDDVVIQDRTLTEPAKAWARRPVGKTLVAQSAGDRPSGGGAAPVADGGGEAEAYADDGYDDSGDAD